MEYVKKTSNKIYTRSYLNVEATYIDMIFIKHSGWEWIRSAGWLWTALVIATVCHREQCGL